MAGAFRQVGVRAVVQGFSRYMSETKQYMSATTHAQERIAEATTRANKAIIKIIDDAGIAADKYKWKLGELELAQRSVNEGLQKLADKGLKEGDLAFDKLVFKAAKVEDQIQKTEAAFNSLKDISLHKMNMEMNELAKTTAKVAESGEGGGILGAIFGKGAAGKLGAGVAAITGIDWLGQNIGKMFTGLLGSILRITPPFSFIIAGFKELQRVVRFVAGVLGTLIKVLGTLAGVLIKVLTPLFNLVKTLAGVFVGAVKAAVGFVVELAGGILKLAADIAGKALNAIFQLAGSLAGFAGKSVAWAAEAAASALQGLMGALSPIIEEAWAGAEAFQRLSIRFEGLVANELVATGATDNFADALIMAEKPAEDLLYWMRRLAVTTPFSRADISETMAFSMAMGFSSEMAQRLTLAIGEHVAGMGLQSDTMERIILQFGQMQAGGRLYGTELRDLARGAFVPVNLIIRRVAEAAGMAAREWQELAATGQVELMPFFEEFITLAHERFPGAMDRMNQTLTAVKQNVHDFITEFLGVEMLGDTLEAVSRKLNTILDELLAPEVMEAFGQLGSYITELVTLAMDMAESFITGFFGLDKALDTIIPNLIETTDALDIMAEAGDRAIDRLGGFQKLFIYIAAGLSLAVEQLTNLLRQSEKQVEDFGVTLRQKAVEAIRWGANIVTNLAVGMIRGATQALTMAMNFITRLLTSWLAPGSPPRVAPDLLEWGAAALGEWLRGMTEADFSILEAIQSPLQSVLGIMEKMGVISRNEVGPLFAEFSKALIEGFASGGLSPDLLDAIKDSFDEFGDEIVKLIQHEYELAEAIKAVEDAEKALEDARKRHTKATADVAREITDYNRMLREGAGAGELAAQRELINQAQKRRVIAAKDIDVASESLELAQENRDTVEEQTELQRKLLDQMIKIAQAQFDITEETSKALKGAAGAIEEEMENAIENMMGAGVGAASNLSKAFEEARDDIKKAWATLFDDLEWDTKVGSALTELKNKFNEFQVMVIEPLMIALGFKEMPEMPQSPAGDLMDEGMQELFLHQVGLAGAFENFAKGLQGVGRTIMGLFTADGAFGILKRDFLWFKDDFLPVIPGMIASFADALGINGLQGTVDKLRAPTWEEFTTAVTEFTEQGGIWDTWMEKLEGVTKWLLGDDKSLGNEIGQLNREFLPAFEGLLKSLWKLFDKIAKLLGLDGGEDITVNSGLGRLIEWLTQITEIGTGVSDALGWVVDRLQGIADAVNAIVGAWQALQAVWDMLADPVKNVVSGGVHNLLGIPEGGGIYQPGILPPKYVPRQHGAWSIPYDNYAASLHAGEMVLPRKIAAQIRAMASAPVASMPVMPQNSVNFYGGINVSDNMSWAEAQARTERMVGGLL